MLAWLSILRKGGTYTKEVLKNPHLKIQLPFLHIISKRWMKGETQLQNGLFQKKTYRTTTQLRKDVSYVSERNSILFSSQNYAPLTQDRSYLPIVGISRLSLLKLIQTETKSLSTIIMYFNLCVLHWNYVCLTIWWYEKCCHETISNRYVLINSFFVDLAVDKFSLDILKLRFVSSP